jgi:molecular chaperone DnaK
MTAFGIDFGTTNSAAVKLAAHAEPQHYGDEAGAPYPSVVAIDQATGRAYGGRSVWQTRERYTESGNYHVIQSVKSLLGTDSVWQTEAGPRTPQDVATFILKALSDRASALGLEPIGKAAITIPVGFPPAARADLRRAAERAGIRVSTFVTESTAAFMRYLPRLRHCRYVAIFDWGGGTLDVSILELRDGTVFELATQGLPIAGDEIDTDLARAVHTRVMEQRGQTHSFDSMPSVDRDNLRTKCEEAKRRLSTAPTYDILLASNYGGSPLHIEMDAAWFKSIVSPRVDLAIETLSHAIQSCRLSFDAIDRLLIVGGSSKIKLLQDKLLADARYSAALQISYDAEWDVAHGAAIVETSPGGYELAESIGVILSDNSFYEIVSRGERPWQDQRSLVLSLIEDAKQANIIIDKRPHAQSPLSERVMSFGVSTLGFNLEEIQLRYSINSDLMLRLEAVSSRLSQSDVARHEYGKLLFAYRLPDAQRQQGSLF